MNAHEVHAKLASHVARHGLLFREIAVSGAWGSDGRLDAVLLTYTSGHQHPKLQGFEVKVTTADLRQDIAARKWEKYLPNLDQMWFAVTGPLRAKALQTLPEWVGVKVAGERGITTARHAHPRGVEAPPAALTKLLHRLHDEQQRRGDDALWQRWQRMTHREKLDDLALLTSALNARTRSALRAVSSREAALVQREEQVERLEEQLKRREAAYARLAESAPDVAQTMQALAQLLYSVSERVSDRGGLAAQRLAAINRSLRASLAEVDQ